MARYYICGTVGSGTEADPYRPEIADDLATMRPYDRRGETVYGGIPWGSAPEVLSLAPLREGDRHIVVLPDATEAEHAELGYDKKTNPNGYDYFIVNEDGTVSVHAA